MRGLDFFSTQILSASRFFLTFHFSLFTPGARCHSHSSILSLPIPHIALILNPHFQSLSLAPSHTQVLDEELVRSAVPGLNHALAHVQAYQHINAARAAAAGGQTPIWEGGAGFGAGTFQGGEREGLGCEADNCHAAKSIFNITVHFHHTWKRPFGIEYQALFCVVQENPVSTLYVFCMIC